MFTPYEPPEMNLTAEKLTEIADGADIGILTVGRNSGEGGDRVEANDFLLSEQEQEMIERTCKVFHKKGKKVGVLMRFCWHGRADRKVATRWRTS